MEWALTGRIRIPHFQRPFRVTAVRDAEDFAQGGSEAGNHEPNIVIERFRAFSEDSVNLLRVGDTTVEIELVRPCRRCVIITTDQFSGVRVPESLRTLATYRTRRMGDGSRGVIFGQKDIPRTLGTIRAGDRVCAST